MRVLYKRPNKPHSYQHRCEVPAASSLQFHSSACALLSGCSRRQDFHFSSTAWFHLACKGKGLKCRPVTEEAAGKWAEHLQGSFTWRLPGSLPGAVPTQAPARGSCHSFPAPTHCSHICSHQFTSYTQKLLSVLRRVRRPVILWTHAP